MKIKLYLEYLRKLNACEDAVIWSAKFKTSQEAWDNCERGDYMLWLLGKLAGKPKSKSRKKVVLTACKCARLSLKYVPKNEKRPLRAIETAESWARGGATLKEVRTAASAAADAGDAAAYATYAASAAYAAYATYAAASAAYAASADAAAYAASAASADAAASAARSQVLKKCAKIVRKEYPKLVINKVESEE